MDMDLSHLLEMIFKKWDGFIFNSALFRRSPLERMGRERIG